MVRQSLLGSASTNAVLQITPVRHLASFDVQDEVSPSQWLWWLRYVSVDKALKVAIRVNNLQIMCPVAFRAKAFILPEKCQAKWQPRRVTSVNPVNPEDVNRRRGQGSTSTELEIVAVSKPGDRSVRASKIYTRIPHVITPFEKVEAGVKELVRERSTAS